MRLSRPVLFVLGVVACALVAFAAVKGVRLIQDKPQQAGGGIIINAAGGDVGGPFTLVNHDGETVTDADFRGRYMLIFFGFSFCPDVCPTELQAMGRALDRLDPETAEKIVPLFISVDPARDTPEELAKYVKAFHPRMIGLTGSRAQIDAAVQEFRAYYKLGQPSEPGAKDYLVDHTSFQYLVGPDGELAAILRAGAGPEEIADALRRLVD